MFKKSFDHFRIKLYTLTSASGEEQALESFGVEPRQKIMFQLKVQQWKVQTEELIFVDKHLLLIVAQGLSLKHSVPIHGKGGRKYFVIVTRLGFTLQ